MTIHEIVLCELAGSQNWSNRLFYQHDFVRDCSDHLERDREIYKRLNEYDVTEVRLTI